MATLLFAAAGSAIGGAIGGSVLGVSAAVIGQAAGGIVGRVIDNALFGGLPSVSREGPRLESVQVMTAQEGVPLTDLAGRSKIGGTVIWATRLREETRVNRDRVGSGKQKQTVTTTSFEYFASFAVSLGEGPAAHLGRIWADGRLFDFSDMIAEGRLRFYTGSEDQLPDPLIEAVEGPSPAFRGTAYLVFEDLPLEDFGNRVPQITAEVWSAPGEMEALVRGVNVIPGSTEWGYSPAPVNAVSRGSFGEVVEEFPENNHRFKTVSDWSLSMDMLGDLLPNAGTVSLIVAWFGTDLRAGLCEIKPRVENKEKETQPAWAAAGLTRATAELVGQVGDAAAFGSAPADASVIGAITDLRARGYRVVFYPFIMMDIPGDAALPAPDGQGMQGAFPWRGRIAPRAGEDVAAEIAAFMGDGASDWRFRRFILHLADLAAQAGGVDAFLIGSELRDLTMARAADESYPFVDALRGLAGEVRGVLGPQTLISYAADWSEYHSHRVGGDVRFHLDPLWADAQIDFVGIDNYLPMSDWRPGRDHLDFDAQAGPVSPYDLGYLKSNIEGGEFWDWFYADQAAREAQDRTPIFDGAHGEHWVFRQKAIRDWHGTVHHDRLGGVRAAQPTAWVPGSKPVWFTETGCPAVDLGTNQPNVFFAANSSEAALPHFSAGVRDDFIQRQFLRAQFEWWAENGAGVLDVNDIQVWAWDARLWPEFPSLSGLWADGPDWRRGHWLNGRAGAAPAAETIARRLTRQHGLPPARLDVSAAHGQADGYPASGPMGFRDWLQPLEVGLALTAWEEEGVIVIAARGAAREAGELIEDRMAERGDQLFDATRGALEDVARAAEFKFRNGSFSYDAAVARARIQAGGEAGIARAESPLVLDFDRGAQVADRLLFGAAEGRERLVFSAPRSAVDLRPGRILPVRIEGALGLRRMLVERVTLGEALAVEARIFAPQIFEPSAGVFRLPPRQRSLPSNAVLLVFLDLPILPEPVGEDWDGVLAAHASPWPGLVTVSRGPAQTGTFSAAAPVEAPATIGTLTGDLGPGPCAVFTPDVVSVDVEIFGGSLVSRSREDVLAGANLAAIRHATGWEVLSFTTAELIGPRRYRLSGLLRGQRGSEHLVRGTAPSGARIVMLDGALRPAGLAASEAGADFWWRWGPAARPVAEHQLGQHRFAGEGLRPFAPVHLRAHVQAGDWRITWIRRSRLPVDTWWETGIEPPLGEASERYRVEIGPEGAPLRVIEIEGAQEFLYTAAMASADGVAPPFALRVAQISDTAGPGRAAELEVTG
ncbi:hypothetical protein ACSSV4_000591 [Roseovarius sp. MBR-154]|jgi:hypothetical protein